MAPKSSGQARLGLRSLSKKWVGEGVKDSGRRRGQNDGGDDAVNLQKLEQGADKFYVSKENMFSNNYLF